MTQPRGPIIHRTKLFGGVRTAEEVHAELGFGERCLKCGGPPVIQVRSFMLLQDFIEKSPELAMATALLNNPAKPEIPCVQMSFGAMVRISTVTACRHHQKELEMTAAKAPSWYFQEIDRGPGADKPMVQVA